LPAAMQVGMQSAKLKIIAINHKSKEELFFSF